MTIQLAYRYEGPQKRHSLEWGKRKTAYVHNCHTVWLGFLYLYEEISRASTGGLLISVTRSTNCCAKHLVGRNENSVRTVQKDEKSGRGTKLLTYEYIQNVEINWILAYFAMISWTMYQEFPIR